MLDTLFEHKSIDLDVLKDRAFNHRWAEQKAGVIPLTAADPDFKVAKEITSALNEYIAQGYFSYGPALGYESFRASVANWYKRKHYLNISDKLVVGFNSAAEALDRVAAVLFEEGGSALIPDPVDFLFQTSISRNGGVTKAFNFDLGTGKIDLELLESKIEKDTKAIYLCNPNNPSGHLIKDEDLAELVLLAEKYDLMIVSDEIWIDIYYEEQIKSVAAINDLAKSRTIIISGLSKNFGLAGLRIGYCICPDESFRDLLLNTSGHEMTIGGMSTLSQVAATTALTDCDYWLDGFRGHLSDLRSVLLESVNEIPGFSMLAPKGTYLAFIGLYEGVDEQEIAEDIKQKVQVALVPGSARWFGPAASGHLRLCFSTSKENIEEAMSRLSDYAHKYL